MSRTKRHDIRPFNQKFWEDRQGNFVVWQKPNIWLTTWFITMVINWFSLPQLVHKIVGWTSMIALIVWAILEVTKGVNYFRRLIGLLVLLIMILARI